MAECFMENLTSVRPFSSQTASQDASLQSFSLMMADLHYDAAPALLDGSGLSTLKLQLQSPNRTFHVSLDVQVSDLQNEPPAFP